jgi:hypothetical protein
MAEQTYDWNPEKRDFGMRVLTDFIARVERIAPRDAALLVMCRSGGRSATAVDLLCDAGFTRGFQILDGVEGDRIGEAGASLRVHASRTAERTRAAPGHVNLTRSGCSDHDFLDPSDGAEP